MFRSVTTLLLPVDPFNPEAARIELAAAALRRGELVAFPTETVYGLGAHALDAAAVARIFAAKERPASDPLIIHVAAVEQLDELVANMPSVAHELARQFWPGPLTLVLPRRARVPASVSAGMDSVAVRVPNHPVALALLRAAALPVAAPSANRFTRPSPTTAQHVLHDLDGRVEYVLDSGPTPIGLESSVVSLMTPVPTLLRPGGVSVEELRRVVPELVYQPRYLDIEEQASAPGMLLKHYAPNAEVRLYRGAREAVLAQMHADAETLRHTGRRVGVLVPDEEAALFDDLEIAIATLGSRNDLTQVAANLFAAMRQLEAAVDVMLVRGFEQERLGLAIWDRLLRATEGHVIDVYERSSQKR